MSLHFAASLATRRKYQSPGNTLASHLMHHLRHSLGTEPDPNPALLEAELSEELDVDCVFSDQSYPIQPIDDVPARAAARAFFPETSAATSDGRGPSTLSPRAWTFLAAIVLALAVGAKIYPIVLAPLLFLSAWHRIGRPVALSAGVIS